jgi:membrane dipeptidase
MYVIDGHCDALWQLWQDPDKDFGKEDSLHTSLPRLKKGKVKVQVYALYVPSHIPPGRRFETVLEMIRVYEERVVKNGVRPIREKRDLNEVLSSSSYGGLLWLEGGHALEEDISHLQMLHQRGVKGIGLTWNFRNAWADGCHEPNPGGLSQKGRQLVEEMNRLGMIVDVSHLAEKGFWDVMERASTSVIATHSNARNICNHPRNLSDEQIRAIALRNGLIGLTFVPMFTREDSSPVAIDDLLRHVEHVCSLAGADHVAFGSDFDGIEQTYTDLTDASRYPLLINELLKRYREAEVKKFLHENWLRVFQSVLQ